MNLVGEHTTSLPATKVWNMLMDPDTLARVTPFITKLESIDGENYKSIAEVKIGPVGGTFTGSVAVTDKTEPSQFKLTIVQNSKMGNARAEIMMNIKPVDDASANVSFDGKVALAGVLATMGGRVLTPIANLVAKQFFKNLEEEVAKAGTPPNFA